MKILFIGHNAYPAGAQLLLLRYLQWLSVNRREIDIHVLLMKSGPLLDTYQKTGVFHLYPTNNYTKNPFLKFYIKLKQVELINRLLKENFDLIYSNTILNASILQKLTVTEIPVITHVHEMSFWFDQLSVKEIELLKNHTNYFFTASRAVSEKLEDMKIVNSEDTFPVYVFADDQVQLKEENQFSLRKQLDLSPDAILVGACGSENFRKGKDWFVPISISVLSTLSHLNVHFVWIGGTTSNEMEFDRRQSGFSNHIHFIDNLANAHLYFHEFSLFLMISREDPFPIVNIEAGIQGIPVLSFMNNGGTQELLEYDPALLVPYGNLQMMAECIISLLTDPDLLREKGKLLQERIKSRYTKDHVSDNITNKLLEIYSNFKASKR